MTVSAVGSAVGRAGNSGHLSNFNNILLEIQALDHKVSSNTLLDIYQALHQQMPAFSGEQMRRFNVLEVYQKLVAHPTASEHANEQARLATDLGDWQQLNNSFQEAYFYYVMALNWQESDERHRLATIAFLKWTFEKLAKSISTLKPEALNRVIDELFSFHSSAEEVEQLSEFITGIISSSGTRFNLLGQCARHFKERRLSPPPSSTDYLTKRHRTKFNKDFVVSFPKAQVSNSVVLESFTDMLRPMMEYMRDLIGPLPEGYDFRLIGSFARNEGCPASDFEWFGLVKEKEKSDELKLFAEGIHMLVSAFGKTPFTKNNLFVAKFPDIDQTHEGVGFRVDDGAHPALCDPRMLGTVEEFSEINSPDPDQKYDLSQEPYFNLILPSVSIFSDDEGSQLYSNYRELITEKLTPSVRSLWVQKAFEFLKENFDQTLPSKKLDLKMQFIRPLNLLIHLLALREGIEESNTIKIVEALPFFDSEVKNMIKTSVEAIYQMRIRLHQHYGAEIDAAPTSGPGAIFFTPQENRILQATHLLLLKPLYCSDTVNNLLADEIFDSLLSIGNENPKSLFEYFAALGVSMEFHGRSYRKLIDKVELASTYLQVLDKNGFNIQELAELQARDGWSYAMEQDKTYLSDALDHMLTGKEGVEVYLPGEEKPRYLDPDVAKQIINKKNGNIQRKEEGCNHKVAFAVKGRYRLHFKQRPNTPLIEYAVYNLSSRIVGKVTPPSQLVRFQINEKSYPVLVSQSIDGRTLKQNPDAKLNSASLTKMLLIAILTKPGDGRGSNYLVDDDGQITCVDNEISFVEPIRKSTFTTKTHFSSLLFCLGDLSLDVQTFQTFLGLNPESILSSWVEDVFQREKEYTTLFPVSARLVQYDDGKDNHFTPKFPIIKGTLATLYMQFLHLQQVIRLSNCQMQPFQLLEALITMQSTGEKETIGGYIARKYRETGRGLFPEERLTSIVEAAQVERSISSTNALKALFGKIPKAEDLEKVDYSLEQAKNELNSLIVCQFLSGSSITQNNRTILNASFENIEPKRHEGILNALKWYIQENFKKGYPKITSINLAISQKEQIVPNEAIFSYCQAIMDLHLASFVNRFLSRLELTHCPNITHRSLEIIADNSPSLKELRLSASGIDAIARRTIVWGALKMPSLTKLHASKCKNLKSILLEAPKLQSIEFKENPKLEEASIPGYVPSFAFGKAKWEEYIGDIEEEPPIPPKIFARLYQPCRIWRDRLASETHALVLIPNRVNGEPLTRERLKLLVADPRKGESVEIQIDDSFSSLDTVRKSYWIFMSRRVIPESRGKYKRREQLHYSTLENFNKTIRIDYKIPSSLEAATCILMDFFGNNHLTYRRRERVSDESYKDLNDVTVCGDSRHWLSTDDWAPTVGSFHFSSSNNKYILLISSTFFDYAEAGLAVIQKA